MAHENDGRNPKSSYKTYEIKNCHSGFWALLFEQESQETYKFKAGPFQNEQDAVQAGKHFINEYSDFIDPRMFE